MTSYIKVASDQPGGSSDDPSIPPPAKFRKVVPPLISGGMNNEHMARVLTVGMYTTMCFTIYRDIKGIIWGEPELPRLELDDEVEYGPGL